MKNQELNKTEMTMIHGGLLILPSDYTDTLPIIPFGDPSDWDHYFPVLEF